MYKFLYVKIAKEIKKYFVEAGFDGEEYDQIVENLRMSFPSGKENDFKITLEDFEGNKYESVEYLENAYAFNIVKVILKEGKLRNIKPVIVFPVSNMESSKVFIFIHEFIHYLTYTYIEKEKYIIYGAGIDLCKIDKETYELKDDQKYLLLNECITNIITYYICRNEYYSLYSPVILNCKYNRCTEYLEKILQEKATVNDLLSLLLKGNKKEIINLFVNENRKEKRLLKNLNLLFKNNIDEQLKKELTYYEL